ncbi:unnamed protein product [Cuscuta europaea]|uniref:t-SNARE coiled-coil homology domain-containing protein n=1 Tax=Cuscuta europaea TaxID=41803 RepID=A0A9P0ZEH5_CUSEU|nr:unnamed protein product [Cuscuta europaea]
MNDLMTKSFMSYVDLKKQAMKDLETGPNPDIEMGQLDPADEKNLSQFFEEVGSIKAAMDDISNLLLDLQDLNEQTKSSHSAKILHGLRDRINSDMVTVLRKAKIIKTKLESLDKSSQSNNKTPIERTRISVTNGLRQKLRDLMNDFQCLRGKIVADHKEGLKRSYYDATGQEASEEMVEKMMAGGGTQQERLVFEGKAAAEMVKENQVRNEAVKEIQKSLAELHQVFLDMAVMVETQGEQMNNIEINMVNAGSYVKDGSKELDRAKRLKKKKTLLCWVGFIALAIFLLFILAFLF